MGEKYNKSKTNKDHRFTETVRGGLCGFQEITDNTVTQRSLFTRTKYLAYRITGSSQSLRTNPEYMYAFCHLVIFLYTDAVSGGSYIIEPSSCILFFTLFAECTSTEGKIHFPSGKIFKIQITTFFRKYGFDGSSVRKMWRRKG